jgi:multidrug efflux pump subunit AcrB
MSPIDWFARNPVAANLLMWVVLVGGLLSAPLIPQKEMPDIQVDMVTVSVVYRGAAPEEVEQGVCVRVEEELEGIEGIERIRSTSNEGACVVTAELIQGADLTRAVGDVKNRIDALDTLPDEAEKPIVSQVTVRRSVADVAIFGDADERSLKLLAERVRDELTAIPGITQVEVTNARPYEISIEVPESALRRHALSFDQVAQAVRRGSLDLPGGSLKTEGGEILLRTKAQAYIGREFEELVVLTRDDGTRVPLRDVATVIDGFEDTDQWATFDGKPCVMVRVYRVGDQDVIDISNAVKAYVAEAGARMPEGISLAVWRDSSVGLRDRLSTLYSNGIQGTVLVVAILLLFLRARVALWVTTGIPVAMLGTLFVMPALGYSVNSISTFGFIMVLGMLVDDAIVVGENVFTYQQRGEPRLDAAIRGTREVTVPVIFGILTSVAAFSPLLLVPGTMGQIMSVIGTVVILCLLFSMAESQLVLPSHLGHGRDRAPGHSRLGPAAARLADGWQRFQSRFDERFQSFLAGPYQRFLLRTLEWRYTTIAASVALLLLAIAAVASGRLRFSFFPPIEADYVSAQLTMPQGTSAHVTADAVKRVAAAAAELRAELAAELPAGAPSLIRHVHTSLGEQPFAAAGATGPGAGSNTRARTGAHLGEVTLELLPADERELRTSQIAQRWREKTGPIPDAVELLFASALFSVGEAINVQLQGNDVDALREAADRLEAKLETIPGVIDIADSFRAGKKEVKLTILPAAEALGLTQQDLARQVRQAFYGEEAQRVQRGRDDVRVMVRYPESERRTLGDLENMRIRRPDGAEVAFGTVARAELGRGFASIRRADRQRVVNVTADVDRTHTTDTAVVASLEAGALGEILRDYPGMSYRLEGAQREQRRAFGSLFRSAAVALFVIYALLAIPLHSYGQPLLIMSVIPFGIVGGIGGHLLLGKDLAMMSVMGLVAASGVVVNASLVLVHYVNARREQGDSLLEAVRDSAVARFRPILLTSATTFLGLAPLIVERSMQAQFLIPMAISLAFGVLFAAAITLVVIPSGYLILEDLRGLPAAFARLPLRRRQPSRAAPAAAPPRGAEPARRAATRSSP